MQNNNNDLQAIIILALALLVILFLTVFSVVSAMLLAFKLFGI